MMDDDLRGILRKEIEERRLAEEAHALQMSMLAFVRAAWPHVKPAENYRHNWHIEAICEHLEAISHGDITRLQVWVPPGTMKPVDVDALVLMGDGSRKRLGDVEVGDSVITHMSRACRVVAIHEQGELETLEIRTDSGRVVRSAPDHPFLTPSGWVLANDLEAGDTLGTVTCPQTSSSKSRPLEEFRLAGYFVGDGNTSKGARGFAANITCVDPKQGADIVHCCEVMGFTARYAAPGSKARRYNISGGVRPWLRENGLAGKTSWTKRVPEFIFRASDEEIAHFIGAYFACDGTLGHWRPHEPRASATVIFNSVNRHLLEDVQHLLLRFGVKSRLREHVARRNNYMNGEHRSWRLVITSTDDTSKFIASIPVIGVKAERLASIAIKRTRFDERIQPDRVEWIESGGLRECRCLSVEEDHSFTANDLIVKNSLTVSVFWHAWEWTTRPWLRYWGASYETRLAGRLSAMSRDLMLTGWYRERWGDQFEFIRDAEHYYGNNQGGTRLSTAPESTGSGEHGHRILIDDPINAKAADATSKVVLESTNEWYDGTVSSRGLDGVETEDGRIMDHARVIIMQRLHDSDLAAHALEIEDWTVLCIPERYEDNHPYAWRGRAGLRSTEEQGSIIGAGDPREDGELLWPDRRSDSASRAMEKSLGAHRAAGQLQQRPAPREGQMLLRSHWRFYDPAILTDAKRKPRFTAVVQTIDTPLKDKESNDFVAIQAWGVIGADRYLIDLRKGRMNFSQAKRAIKEQASYVRGLYPRCAHYVLIENAGYGVELILELKRELTGVTKISPAQDGDKVMRAEAASSDLESGNCWLPGIGGGADVTLGPVRSASADVTDFIESCALFPNAAHDDDVDAWSQCMNWLRARVIARGRTGSVFKRRRERAAV